MGTLIKRIAEVSKVIEQKTYRSQVQSIRLNIDNFQLRVPLQVPYLGTYNGIPVIESPRRLFMMECRESSDIG